MIRRLDPVTDESLLREAFQWDADAPSWYRQMDAVFGPEDANDFIELAKDDLNAFIGIFHDGLVGVLVVAYAGSNRYAAHLWAKRGAPVETLVNAAISVRGDLYRMGMEEVFIWVAERNLAVRKLCGRIGLRPDEVWMYHGSYKGRVIKWLRYSISRQALELEAAA